MLMSVDMLMLIIVL